jgi:hypothetical protein
MEEAGGRATLTAPPLSDLSGACLPPPLLLPHQPKPYRRQGRSPFSGPGDLGDSPFASSHAIGADGYGFTGVFLEFPGVGPHPAQQESREPFGGT